MIKPTTEAVPGYEIAEIVGVALGNVIRAIHAGTDIFSGLRNFMGGEVTEYTKLIAEAREHPVRCPLARFGNLRANAVVSLRLTTAMDVVGSAEILAYGTAVPLRR